MGRILSEQELNLNSQVKQDIPSHTHVQFPLNITCSFLWRIVVFLSNRTPCLLLTLSLTSKNNVTSIFPEARKLKSSNSEQRDLFVFVILVNVKKLSSPNRCFNSDFWASSTLFTIMICQNIKMEKIYMLQFNFLWLDLQCKWNYLCALIH